MGDYQYFGLVAFIILIIGLAFVILRWPQDKRMTFSQHVAVRKQSIYYYIVLFSAALPLLLLFFIGWFTPTFHLPVWFNILIVVSSIAQYACTLIPEVGGWRTDWHRFLSGVSGVCLIPALALLCVSYSLSLIDRLTVIAGLVLMLGIILILTLNKKEKYEPSFMHQSVYYAAFFAPVLVVSYF